MTKHHHLDKMYLVCGCIVFWLLTDLHTRHTPIFFFNYYFFYTFSPFIMHYNFKYFKSVTRAYWLLLNSFYHMPQKPTFNDIPVKPAAMQDTQFQNNSPWYFGSLSPAPRPPAHIQFPLLPSLVETLCLPLTSVDISSEQRCADWAFAFFHCC